MAHLPSTANIETDSILAALEQTEKDKLRQAAAEESSQAPQPKFHRGTCKGQQGQQPLIYGNYHLNTCEALGLGLLQAGCAN